MNVLPQFIRRPGTRPGVAIGLAAAVGAYALLGFFGVPRLVAGLLTDQVRDAYGRELALGEVRFNPFTLALEIRDVLLPDADGSPLLTIDRLFVNLDLASIWRRAISLREVAIEGPMLAAIVRPGGELNLADLKPPPAEPAAPDATVPRVMIGALNLRNGRLRFEDRDRPQPFVTELDPVEFVLTDFSTHAGTGNVYRFDARLFDGALVAWQGTLDASPFASDGQFALRDLPLPRLAAYLGDGLPFRLSSGVATLGGSYRIASGDGPGIARLVDTTLQIRELKIRPDAQSGDVMEFPRIAVTGIHADAGTREARIGEVQLTGGVVRAWLEPDGQLNLDALVPQAADDDGAATDATGAAAEEAGWQLELPLVTIGDLSVEVEDRQVEPAVAVTVSPFAATVSGFATTPGTTVELKAEARINETGSLAGTATLDLDSGAVTAAVEAAALDLRIVQPYLARVAGLTLTEGTAGGSIRLGYVTAGDSPKLELSGDVTVEKFRTVDDVLREDFVRWDRLQVRGIDYRSSPAQLRIREIVARGPYARVIIGPDRTTNVATILGSSDEVQPAGTGPTADEPAIPVRVGMIRVQDGSTNFADLSITPNFATGIGKLSGTVTGLDSARNARAKVELDGEVDRFSPVTIRGEVNPLNADGYLDLAMTFRNLELAGFTPYSGRFAGYAIRRGKLSVDLNYKVENRLLDAHHKFVVDQLELGDKVESPDAVSLPLKLAVALLKDRNGVIDLDLPVTGSLDDPEFRVGPIVWKAFVNLLTKAVTAPFALLGSLFGGGEEVNVLGFEAGEAAVGGADEEKLASLVTALSERPGLELNVPAVFNRELDGAAFVQRQLEERVVAAGDGRQRRRQEGRRQETESDTVPSIADLAETAMADRDDYLRRLQRVFREVAGPDAELPRVSTEEVPAGDIEADGSPEALIGLLEDGIRARLTVSDDVLFALAKERAEGVQERLLAGTGIDPTRVFLTVPSEGKAEGRVVTMELGLR